MMMSLRRRATVQLKEAVMTVMRVVLKLKRLPLLGSGSRQS